MLTVTEAYEQLEKNIVLRMLSVYRNDNMVAQPRVARIDSLLSIFAAHVKSSFVPSDSKYKSIGMNQRFGKYSSEKGVRKAKSLDEYAYKFGSSNEYDFSLFSLDENGKCSSESSAIVGNAQGLRYALGYMKHILCSKKNKHQKASWKEEFEVYFAALELFITRKNIHVRRDVSRVRKCYDFSEDEEEEDEIVDSEEEQTAQPPVKRARTIQAQPAADARRARVEVFHLVPRHEKIVRNKIVEHANKMESAAAEALLDIESSGNEEGEAKLPALPFAPHRQRAIDLKTKLTTCIAELSALEKEVSVINDVIAKHTTAQVSATSSVLNTLASRVKKEYAPKFEEFPWVRKTLDLDVLEDDVPFIERGGKRSEWCRTVAKPKIEEVLKRFTETHKTLVELLDANMDMGAQCAFSYEYEENYYNETCAQIEASLL